ncbi:hypothetical protein LTR27_002865 [Elasticomyces elasticus]|nr:hypothetical protein LTR27_002865 [Elasticomyces elasticus]
MPTTERASIAGADISTPEDTPTSHFLSLPPELRNRIYEYVMTVGTVYVQHRKDANQLRGFAVSRGDENPSPREERSKVIRCVFDSEEHEVVETLPAGGQSLSLLRTCRQVYQEAAQLFYVCNRFEVQVDLPGTGLEGGLIRHGLFAFNIDQDPKIYASGLQKFGDTIGSVNAKALTDVVFAMGQIDSLDLYESLIGVTAIVEQLVSLLRHAHATRLSWRLKGDHDAAELHEVLLSMEDFRGNATAAVARLNERITAQADLRGHVGDFIDFLELLRKVE